MKKNFAKTLAVILSVSTAVTMSAGTIFADSESDIAADNSDGAGLIEEEINDENLITEEPAGTIIPETEEPGDGNEQDDIPEWAVDDEGSNPVLFDAFSLPYRFDMRDYGWVTPVKLQNPWGSCWSFGGTAAAESSILSSYDLTAEESHLDLSERHTVWNVFRPITELENPSQAGEGLYTIDKSINAPFDAGGGAVMLSALYASGTGPLEEAYYPYWGKDKLTVADTMDLCIDDTIKTTAPAMGMTEEQFIQMLMDGHGFTTEQEVRDYIASVLLEDLTYSKFDDWSIPATTESGQSTRNLSEGFVLKNSNVIPDYRTEEGETSQDAIRAMKQEMINGRAICISYGADQSGTYVNSAEFSTDGRYGENVYGGVNYAQYRDAAALADHSVCIIGWDDNFASTNFKEGCQPPGNGAWIVKNSWGSETDGDVQDANGNYVNKGTYGAYNAEGKTTGYFYLSYYDQSIDLRGNETFEFSSNLAGGDSFEVTQYDYLPGVSQYYTYETDEVLGAANVFTAVSDSDLVSISTRCANTNTRVIYAVYLLDENAKNPADGELVCKGSVNYEYGGYHRIDMDLPVHLEEGQRFSVVTTGVNINSDGSRRYAISTSRAIDHETATKLGAKYYAQSVINEGESFLYEGDEWTDWKERAEIETEKIKTETGYGFLLDNFSIKAYFVPSESGKTDISTAVVEGIENKTYTGKPVTQEFTVAVGGVKLIENSDYFVKYDNNTNAGTAAVTITGVGDYTGTVEKTFTISPLKITLAVTLGNTSYTYNGKMKTPSVTVKYKKQVLDESSYDVVYAKGRKNVGSYKVTVTMKNNYSGTGTAAFKITRADNKITNVKTSYSKTLNYSKKAQKVIALKPTAKENPKFTYKITSMKKGSKTIKTGFTVSKTGEIKAAKKLEKGSYTVIVKISAAKTSNYNATSKAVTLKVKIK